MNIIWPSGLMYTWVAYKFVTFKYHHETVQPEGCTIILFSIRQKAFSWKDLGTVLRTQSLGTTQRPNFPKKQYIYITFAVSLHYKI